MEEDILLKIDEKIGEVRTESIDISCNEIMSLIENKEMVIQPDYQRLFRWSDEQKSKLVESIILELPIPEIYVVENEDGIFELVDGLQRVSSITQFVNPEILNLDGFTLNGCDLIDDLNGNQYEDLPLRLKLRLKRAVLRTVIIKRQSKKQLRYQMFKRLNTGGSNLSEQEIRNVTARMIGENGKEFYDFLKKMSDYPAFQICIETLPDTEISKKMDEELILRFFAAKNFLAQYRGNIANWLNEYMESILLKGNIFNYRKEEKIFVDTFTLLSNSLGAASFVRYKAGRPLGSLSPAYYEAVAVGLARSLDFGKIPTIQMLEEVVPKRLQEDVFKRFTGPSASKRSDIEGRINSIFEIIP
ncbi:DUF262 domain-containing protein [Leptospira sarikeiensis]|uniref:DUF262 domain-containing protein n=1 Tax=Leptospira sarikeiensis TaxID=2484943 RepID=A0A4R9KBR5_9LEPT|nr:DUF262 domain-containing protein [Leptospira sarikeiensis]TGL63506.1 DUF262 domain-containing protein [Leptospira sarikeiensis]